MHSYFNKYCFKNTVLKDLLLEMKKAMENNFGELKSGSKYDIKLFEEEWICKAGMNVIVPEWDNTNES